jgi:small subunit ribosomal protein S8e
LTGGRRNIHQKKRKHEMGRPSADTKIGTKRIHLIRGRGGNLKFRAIKLDTGNYAWGSEGATRKARILDVVYNASNMELVCTKTLVKNSIVQIDATPFRLWYEQHYGVELGKKKKEASEKGKQSKHVQKKIKARNEERQLEHNIKEQFNAGRLLACVSSRPAQHRSAAHTTA